MSEKPTYEEFENQIHELKNALQDRLRMGKILSDEIHRRRNLIDTLKYESEERFRVLSDDLPALICEFLPDSTLTFVNKVYCEFFAKPVEALIGRRFLDFIPKDQKESVKAAYMSLTPQQPLRIYTHKVIKNGGIVWQEWRDRAIFNSQGKAVKYRSVGFDITDRKRSEEALQESEKKYRLLFELESDAIFLIDKDTGNILEANASATKLYGFSRKDLLRMKNVDLSAEADKTKHATQQQYIHIPIRYHRKKDGTVFPVEITASHFKWNGRDAHIAAVRDITSRVEAESARNELEKQLYHAQKMESIGTLTSGIAHDFNNILGIIDIQTTLALGNVPESNQVYSQLKEIEKACQKAEDIVKQLLNFGCKTDLKLQPLMIASVIEDALKFIKSSIPTNIAIEQDIQAESETVLADPVQISQIILNLCINAFQAMERTGGTLTVAVKKVTVNDNLVKNHPDLKRGRHINITVSDTGPGIASEVIDRIFDPYFTTKAADEGSGMGLAVVQSFVNNYNGVIFADSKPGQGATFNIFLPVVEESVLSDKSKGQITRKEKSNETFSTFFSNDPCSGKCSYARRLWRQ